MEIGYYIKDIFGRIGKIKSYSNGTYFTEKFGASSGEIVKHSKNIIDLIEVGDYVNGHKVIEVDNHNKGMMREVYCEDDEDFGIWDEMIESVLTKEQFESIEYRLEE